MFGHGAVHDVLERGLQVDVGVRAVAVGRLADEVVHGGERLGGQVQLARRSTDVSAEQDPPRRAGLALDAEKNARRPEQVPASTKLRAQAVAEHQGLMKRARAERADGATGVLDGEEGLRRAMLREAPIVRVVRLVLLDVRGVQEQVVDEVGRGVGGVDGPREALAHEERQPAAVVQVRVGQQDRVDLVRGHGGGRPVPLPQRLRALEEAAIHEETRGPRLEQVPGPGDGARGTQKLKTDAHEATSGGA